MKSVTELVGAVILFSLAACSIPAEPEKPSTDQALAPGSQTDFQFESGGQQLSGVFDLPESGDANAIVLFVHGYGETNIREWNSFADLRQRFNEIGIATAVWDKPGQGQSEGTFDINQSVHSSAQEVIDAASFLRASNAPGSHKIGIWGVSRAGWIAPIAMSYDSAIEFWISVSGTTAEDNFSYLLLSNLPYEGGTEELARKLADEWRAGCEVFRNVGSYGKYLDVTRTLRANEYIKQMRGEWQARAEYETQQQTCASGSCSGVDNDMCSYIHIDGFETMLSSLNIDVLAIFGEKDLNVDWRKTRTLYQATIGQNPQAALSITQFQDADHNLNFTETGSIREMQSMASPRKIEGYYDVQVEWLKDRVPGLHAEEP